MSTRYWIALQDLLAAKPLVANALVTLCGSAEAIFCRDLDTLECTPPQRAAIAELRRLADFARIARIEQQCVAHGIHLLTMDDPRYPVALTPFPDRPPLLFIKGELSVLSRRPMVAIVGSRKATTYGREMAMAIADGLARAGVTVVSGLALGVDGAAHRATLAAGGTTIGVLGGGHEKLYPPQHRDLADQICRHGVVISEFLPTADPNAWHFPQRNRIISGLSMAVVVVEAARRSGTLSTAYHANEQGRLVFAVPGAVGQVTTRGTHQLLRQGALIAEGATDILDAIQPMCAVGNPSVAEDLRNPATDALGSALFPLLKEPQLLDTLATAAEQPVPAVLAWLTAMETAGTVTALPGNRFVVRSGHG